MEYDCPTVVPNKYTCVTRKAVREILLERKTLPTIDSAFNRSSKLKLLDVEHFNVFNSENLLEKDSLIWPWSR